MKTILNAWPLWAVLSAVFAALTAILSKVGVKEVDPDIATVIRTLVILFAALLLVQIGRGWSGHAPISGRSWLFLVLSGLATGASWICYLRALKFGDAARVAPVDKLSVVFVAICATLFLGEKLTILQWFGVILIGAGAMLVAWKA